jgi:hypothetical protein
MVVWNDVVHYLHARSNIYIYIYMLLEGGYVKVVEVLCIVSCKPYRLYTIASDGV